MAFKNTAEVCKPGDAEDETRGAEDANVIENCTGATTVAADEADDEDAAKVGFGTTF